MRSYLVAGVVRAISGDEILVVLNNGKTVHCAASDLIRVAGYVPLDGADAMTGALKLPNGSAASPAVQASMDPNTGLYFIGADTLGLATGGSERMRVNGAGAVGFGVNPSYPIHSYGAGNRAVMVESSTASASELRLKNSAQNWSFGLSAIGAFVLTDWTAVTSPFWLTQAAPSFSFFMDGAGKCGFSALTIDSTVQIAGSLSGKVVTVTTTPYSAGHELTILVDATAGNKTVNLPAGSTALHRLYHVKKIDSSSNTVTIDGNASQTIDGALTKVLATQYDSITIQCDGTNWHILN